MNQKSSQVLTLTKVTLTKVLTLTKVYLPVSLVSAFCGRHTYKTQHQAFSELLQRYNPIIWKEIKRRAIKERDVYTPNIDFLRDTIPDLGIDSTRSNKDNYKQLVSLPKVAKALASVDKVKVDTEERVKNAVTEIEHEVTVRKELIKTKEYKQAVEAVSMTEQEPDSQMDERSKKVRTIIAKDRGTNLEKSTATTLGKVKKQVAVQRWFDDTKTTGFLQRPKEYTFMISGFIDAIDQEKEMIYEIKNRTNRFFVPQYDIDQLVIYMILFPQKWSGSLVQQYNGDTLIDPTITYGEARKMWKEIRYEIIDSITELNEILADDKRCSEFVLSSLVWNKSDSHP